MKRLKLTREEAAVLDKALQRALDHDKHYFADPDERAIIEKLHKQVRPQKAAVEAA